MVGDCVAGDALDFAGVDGTERSDLADCCFGTSLVTSSFAFSFEPLWGGAGSVAGWERRAASAGGSSGHGFEGAAASLSASSFLLSSLDAV